ncbi:MAG: hypothetical protein IH611_03725 [Deltaproteobacteria bacterium]|nr:hypothetical protein [Deltaproteobacteria bacterium]
MIPRSRRWLILLFAAVPFLAIADLPKNPAHDFRGKCDGCHLSVSGGKRIFTRDMDSLCGECHPSLGLSHPTGMRPSFGLPPGFPLDWNGRLTCATCHDPHGGREYLLRTGKSGRSFCIGCHTALPGTHGDARQSAHTGSRRSPRGLEPAPAGGSIDRTSLDCLSCHDAMSSRPADVRMGAGVYNHAIGGSHPVGVDYGKAFTRGGYRPPSGLGSDIVLFDGKVGCGTCHNLYSKRKYHLVADNARSALCLRCHLK